MNFKLKPLILSVFLITAIFCSAESDTVSFYYLNTGLVNISYDYPEGMHYYVGNFELGFCSALGFKFGTSLFASKFNDVTSIIPFMFSYIPYNTNKKTFLNEIDFTLEANAWRTFKNEGDTTLNISYLDARIVLTKRDLLTKFVNLKIYTGFMLYNPLDYKYFNYQPYIGMSISLPVFYSYGSFDSLVIKDREEYFEQKKDD